MSAGAGDDPPRPARDATLRLVLSPAPRPAALTEGTLLGGHYRVGPWLGGGGTGVVHAAEDVRTGRAVAVKALRPDLAASSGPGALAELAARFEREARAATRLGPHPNLVELLEVGVADDGRIFLAMERLTGRPLAHLIATGPVAPARAVALTLQILAALAHAHAAGAVHRDLTPDNVIVIADADGAEQVKLLDFGLVKLTGEVSLTGRGAVIGTPAYMAPEQVLGQAVDARTDLYAVGLLCHALLAGRAPFISGDAMTMMRLHLTQPAPRLEAPVPPALADIVARALCKPPRDRFPDALAMAEALRSISAP